MIADGTRETTRNQQSLPLFRKGTVTISTPPTATVLVDGDTTPIVGTMIGYVGIGRCLVMFAAGGGVWVLDGPAIGWTNLPLAAGWTNWGPPYATGQYMKAGGIVRLKGLVQHASNRTLAICVMPAGFRPALQQSLIFPVSSNDLYGEVRIGDSEAIVGNVRLVAPAGAVAGWVALDGITYRAEA